MLRPRGGAKHRAAAGRRGAGPAARHRSGAAHFRHHGPAQDRPLNPGEPLRLGRQHRPNPPFASGGPLPEPHALVPCSRPDGRGARLPERRRRAVRPAGIRCAALLRPAAPGRAQLVQRRAQHASGDTRPGAAQPGDHRPIAAALHPLFLGAAAAASAGGIGGNLRRPGHRSLRHDRSGPSDDQQPSAPRPAQARQRGPRRRAGSGDHGRASAQAAGRGASGGSGHPRRQCHAGLRGQSAGQCPSLRRWLVPHRRSGPHGCGRLPEHPGPAEGAHQPGRRENLPSGSG